MSTRTIINSMIQGKGKSNAAINKAFDNANEVVAKKQGEPKVKTPKK